MFCFSIIFLICVALHNICFLFVLFNKFYMCVDFCYKLILRNKFIKHNPKMIRFAMLNTLIYICLLIFCFVIIYYQFIFY